MRIKNKKSAPEGPNKCCYCGETYRKQDFSFCPHCGGDGGSIMTKGWKPTKRQKKAYIKKMNNG